MNTFRGVLLAVCLSLFALCTALFDVAYDAGYYHEFQTEHRISESTGKTQETLDQVSADTILYLKNGDESLMAAHFNSRETAHMADVYRLFSAARIVAFVSAAGAVLLAFADFRAPGMVSRRGVFLTQVILWLVLAGLILWGMAQWDVLFTQFHQLFFRNDLWLLNPKTDLMIQMMPAPFFIGMAIEIALKSVGMTLLLEGGWLLVRWHRRHQAAPDQIVRTTGGGDV